MADFPYLVDHRIVGPRGIAPDGYAETKGPRRCQISALSYHWTRTFEGQCMPLVYRAMRIDEDGFPTVERSASGLGVRPGVDVDVVGGDVLVNGMGMSVSPAWRMISILRIPKRSETKSPGLGGRTTPIVSGTARAPFRPGPLQQDSTWSLILPLTGASLRRGRSRSPPTKVTSRPLERTGRSTRINDGTPTAAHEPELSRGVARGPRSASTLGRGAGRVPGSRRNPRCGRRPVGGVNRVGTEAVSGLSEDLYSISEPADEPARELNPQAQAKVTDAFIARESGQWDRALELLRRWGKYVPPAMLSYLRGSIWLEAGDPATASLFYGHAADLEPQNGNYLASPSIPSIWRVPRRPPDVPRVSSLATSRYAPAAVVRACHIALEATRSVPEAAAAALCRRLIPILERTLVRVEADNENGVDLPVYAMTIGLLGFLHEFLGDNQTAVQCYSRGLQLDPNNDALLTARGILLYGSNPLAVVDFELASKRDCPVAWPYFYLAHHYLASGRFKECRAMCERAAHLPAPDSVRSELAEWKAISQAELGFPIALVRASFEEALRRDPSNDRARRNLSLFEAAVGPIPSRPWETRRATP